MPSPTPKQLNEARFEVNADSYKNFILVRPLTIPDDLPFDPYLDARRILAHNWGQYSDTGNVSSICIDTGTEMSYNFLRYVALSGKGNATGSPTYGVEDDAWDQDSYRAHRMQDYQDAQGLTVAIFKAMCRLRGIKHRFILGHEQPIEHTEMVRMGKTFEKQTLTDGYDFEISGKKWQKKLTVFFEEYLWLSNEGYNEMDIRLHLSTDGKRLTKFRSMAKSKPTELPVPFSHEGMANLHRKLAALRRIDLKTLDGPGYNMALYAPGGCGKTSFITSLPEEVFALGPMVYIAYDPAAEQMSSTWDDLLVPRTHV